MNTEYVLGFMFYPSLNNVLLIEKQRPESQKGKYNAPGGKVEEEDELLEDTVVREFKEETGLETRKEDWKAFAELEIGDERVYCFAAVDSRIFEAKTMTDEEVKVCGSQNIFSQAYPLVDNLKVLIVLAASKLRDNNPEYSVLVCKK